MTGADFRMQVEEQFRAEAQVMLALLDAAKQSTRQTTIYGQNNEAILSEFLRKYLPSRFWVSQGQIVDTERRLSPQCDVIIHDETIYPPAMVFANGARTLYLHSVYAVIEVKTTLTKKDLDNTLDAFKRLREMEQSARVVVEGPPPGQAVQIPPSAMAGDCSLRIYKYLFAYRSEISSQGVLDHLHNFEDENAAQGWLLNKIGVLQFPDGNGELLGPARQGLQDATAFSKGSDVLLAFYRTLYNSLCTSDKVEPGNLEGTRDILRKYNAWGLQEP